MPSAEQSHIEALRDREWRNDPLTAEEIEELNVFYSRLDKVEEKYVATAQAEQQTRIAERTQTLAELQTLLHEKQSRLVRIRSLIREMQELEAAESRLLSASVR